MSSNINCSREEATNMTLDEYSAKYFKRPQINGNNKPEMKDTSVNNNKIEMNEMVVDIEPKPYHTKKLNHKNYWRQRKRNNQRHNYNQKQRNNQVTELHTRNRRWNLPQQPYQQLLQNYNRLTKHLPSLLDMRLSPPSNQQSCNVSNYNSTLDATAKPVRRASIDQMSTLADQLLKKFDTLYEIRQSIKVEQEKKTKYNIPIQKEIASIQNKTLFVKCPNSEVVTCDGPGIEVKMPVHSTNLSNNMRFA